MSLVLNSDLIIFKHPDFLVVSKPFGRSFNSEGSEIGFFEELRDLWYNESGEELFQVHRLDKVTSGLVIVARSKSSSTELNRIFANREVSKYYLAISASKPKKKQGTIVGDMVRSRRSSWRLDRTTKNPAITQFFSFGSSLDGRLFLVKILTGKTHQIRVALKSLGSSIIGDPIYSNGNFDRCYLHSYCLSFSYKNEDIRVISIPNEPLFKDIISDIGSRLDLSSPELVNWPKVKSYS